MTLAILAVILAVLGDVPSGAEGLDTLPPPVARYLRLALPKGQPIRLVRITEGEVGWYLGDHWHAVWKGTITKFEAHTAN